MLEATTYTKMYEQQQLEKCLCVARSQQTQKFLLQNYIRVKHFRTFSLYENSSQRNKSELRYALVSPLPSFLFLTEFLSKLN